MLELKGKIQGFFGSVKSGRLPKNQKTVSSSVAVVPDSSNCTLPSTLPHFNSKAVKGWCQVNWRDPIFFVDFKYAVLGEFNIPIEEVKFVPTFPSPTMLCCAIRKFKKISSKENIDINNVTFKLYQWAVSDDQKLLQELIVASDKANTMECICVR